MMLAAAKLSEVGFRVNNRLHQISSSTGLSFASLFTSVVDTVERSGQSAHVGDMLSSVDEMLNRYPGGELPSANTDSSLVPAALRDKPYADMVAELCQKYGMDQILIHAVLKCESNYNPNLKSSAGAIGLMQLMPGTAAVLDVTDSYDPWQNLDGGIRYLAGKLQQYNGDVKMALAAYNCGSYGLSKRGVTDLDNPEHFAALPRETRNYLHRIQSVMATLMGEPSD